MLVGVFSDRRFSGPRLFWVSASRPQDHLRRRRPSQNAQDDGFRTIHEEQEERAGEMAAEEDVDSEGETVAVNAVGVGEKRTRRGTLLRDWSQA